MIQLSSIRRAGVAVFLLIFSLSALADVTRIEVQSRETLTDPAVNFSYEQIRGVAYFALNPDDEANAAITDIQYAPRNSAGLVEFSADFLLAVPESSEANGGLLHNVNNRGRSAIPLAQGSLQNPLASKGFTYIDVGWINELEPREGRLRLHAPVVGSEQQPITGDVRYELSVGQPADSVNIGGGGHLAYAPTQSGMQQATLTQRLYQNDPRVPIERSRFSLDVVSVPNSSQPAVTLNLQGGLRPGYLYELIYEAEDPVLAGAGMAAIRDLVSLIRYGGTAEDQLAGLGLPEIGHAVSWGNSQSGRLLRQFTYDGFNADLEGRQVFDGVIPVIAGSGYGMFNNRFAMPTRTNGHHSNYLYPNDLFPFTYGESIDPFTGRTDSILGKARASDTVPMVMHIQTSNEYWLRGGSLPHTNPQGTADAVIPEEVRFYTIGGSQHGSGNGIPRVATSGQLPPNPNMWAPFNFSLISAMYDWVADGIEPPASRYPKIADGTLVPSHMNNAINRAAWNRLSGVNHPSSMYKPVHVNYGPRWQDQRIIDQHPDYSDHFYETLVPAVNSDNNDLANATLLPPLTEVPVATFVPWNLRAPATGAEQSLARLSGGYIPLPANAAAAERSSDPRNSIAGLYNSYEDYLVKYEAATDQLIAEGYLLPGFKQAYMDIAAANRAVFE